MLIAKVLDGYTPLEIKEIISRLKTSVKEQSLYSICNRPNVGTKEEYYKRSEKDDFSLNLTYVEHKSKS